MNLNLPNYSAWLVDEAAFPYERTIEEKIAFLLRYGVLAPSQHNTQPWLFEIRKNTLLISADLTKALPVGDPENHGLFIGIGACAENIVQAAACFGFRTTVSFANDAAQLVFDEADDKSEDESVLGAITRRHSDKALYDGTPLSLQELAELRMQSLPGIDFAILSEPDQLKTVVGLHAQATGLVSADPAFVRELVGWLRSNNTKAFDGMPGFVSGLSQLKSVVGKFVLVKKPELFQKMAKRDVALMESASAVAVWAAKDLSPATLFNCGRHAERVWLQATELELAVHPMHSICADTSSRDTLAQLSNLHATPVFVVRIGHHADRGLHTPRNTPTWK